MKYKYYEPDTLPDGTCIGSIEITMTEEEILNFYWDFWSKKMKERYGEDYSLITKERCIEDFIIVNWAFPVED